MTKLINRALRIVVAGITIAGIMASTSIPSFAKVANYNNYNY